MKNYREEMKAKAIAFAKVISSNLMLAGAEMYRVILDDEHIDYNYNSIFVLNGIKTQIITCGGTVSIFSHEANEKTFTDEQNFLNGFYYPSGKSVMTEHFYVADSNYLVALGMLEYVHRYGEWSPKGVKRRLSELREELSNLQYNCCDCSGPYDYSCCDCDIMFDIKALREQINNLEKIVEADEKGGVK